MSSGRYYSMVVVENVAEHSWTVSIMAILLKEYANFKVDIEKLMLLIHDIGS